MRIILKSAALLALVYAVLAAGLYFAMRQPPATFGRVMSRVPMPMLAAFPFERMWNLARGGALQPGDVAPEFSLSTLDRQSEVRLSAFRGDRPVLLVFGSYT